MTELCSFQCNFFEDSSNTYQNIKMDKIPADSRGFIGSLLACMFYIIYIIQINNLTLIVFWDYFYSEIYFGSKWISNFHLS